MFEKTFSAAGGGGGAGVGTGGKKVAGLVRLGSPSYEDEMMMMVGISGKSSPIPPSVDHTQFAGGTVSKMVRASPAASGAAHVTCFSSPMEGQTGYFAGDALLFASGLNPPCEVSSWAPLLSNNPHHDGGLAGGLRVSGAGLVQLLKGHGYGEKAGCKMEEVGGSLSQETGLTSDVMNPEISSPAFCEREARKLGFDAQEVPSAPALPKFNPSMDDCIWNY